MRILLADDHTLFRENLRDFLRRLALRVDVMEAGTLEEAEAIAVGPAPLDLIILDLVMPGMGGVAGIQSIRDLRPRVPIVVLSGSTREEDVLGAQKLGARAFVRKTVGGKALLEILKKILDGETHFPAIAVSAREMVVQDMSQVAAAAAVVRPDAFKNLTRRERDVLALLVKGCANKEIARRLGLQEITVKVHLQKTYRKLEVSSRTQAVTKAIALGWEQQDPTM